MLQGENAYPSPPPPPGPHGQRACKITSFCHRNGGWHEPSFYVATRYAKTPTIQGAILPHSWESGGAAMYHNPALHVDYLTMSWLVRHSFNCWARGRHSHRSTGVKRNRIHEKKVTSTRGTPPFKGGAHRQIQPLTLG